MIQVIGTARVRRRDALRHGGEEERPAGEPAIYVSDLVVDYGPNRAVDHLSLTVVPGEVVVVLGPNGAGKTTTVEAIEGYRRPTSGRIRVLGMDPAADQRRMSELAGVMLQQGGVYPAMNAWTALRLFASYYGDHEEPAELIERLSLGAASHTPWRRLSGGEQRRLALALALVGKPRVVMLDEPTAGVDPEGRILVRKVIGDLAAKRNCAVLLTTHELAEAEQVAHRLVVMDRGRIVASGTAAELTSASGSTAIYFQVARDADCSPVAGLLGHPVTREQAGRWHLSIGNPAELATTVEKLASWLASNGIELLGMHAGNTLEDAYLALTRGATLDAPLHARSAPGTEGEEHP